MFCLGLTRPPVVVYVSTHKDEVRLIVHGYFQSQFRVPSCKEVDRPTHDSIKREQDLTNLVDDQWSGHQFVVWTWLDCRCASCLVEEKYCNNFIHAFIVICWVKNIDLTGVLVLEIWLLTKWTTSRVLYCRNPMSPIYLLWDSSCKSIIYFGTYPPESINYRPISTKEYGISLFSFSVTHTLCLIVFSFLSFPGFSRVCET